VIEDALCCPAATFDLIFVEFDFRYNNRKIDDSPCKINNLRKILI